MNEIISLEPERLGLIGRDEMDDATWWPDLDELPGSPAVGPGYEDQWQEGLMAEAISEVGW